jgi:hypothetical protein
MIELEPFHGSDTGAKKGLARSYTAGITFLLLFGLFSQSAAWAQPENQSRPTPPKVIGVTGHLKLGSIITLEVENLDDWAVANDPRKLVPYLNGRELTGVYPDAIHISHNMVIFHLERTPGSMEAWADLLRNPVLRRPILGSRLSVGSLPLFDGLYLAGANHEHHTRAGLAGSDAGEGQAALQSGQSSNGLLVLSDFHRLSLPLAYSGRPQHDY